jgi:hypothetical protein
MTITTGSLAAPAALDLARAMLSELDPIAVAELEHALSRGLTSRISGSPCRPAGERTHVVRAPGSRDAYTREEVTSVLRRCARARARRPTWTTFDAWGVVERERVRRRDGPSALPRVPSWRVFCRLWPSGRYSAALAAAAITDEELRRWRAALLGVGPGDTRSPAQAIAELDDDTLLAAGISIPGVRQLRADGALSLPVPLAAKVARAAGGSLHWLAGCAPEPGTSAQASAFDAPVVSARRAARGISEAQLRRAAGVRGPAWTQIMRGTTQPELGVLAAIAEALGVRCDELCTHVPSVAADATAAGGRS